MEKRSIEQVEKEIEEVRRELLDVHGEETEVYARIVGYYRCVTNWNKGKKDEYHHRKLFEVESGIESGNSEDEFSEAELMTLQYAAKPMNAEMAEESEIDEAEDFVIEDPRDNQIPKIPVAQTIELSGEIAYYEMYTRNTCPHCPPVKQFMSEVKLNGESINVDEPQGLYSAAEKGVFSTPTVIFYDADGNELCRAHNTDELQDITERNRSQAIA